MTPMTVNTAKDRVQRLRDMNADICSLERYLKENPDVKSGITSAISPQRDLVDTLRNTAILVHNHILEAEHIIGQAELTVDATNQLAKLMPF